MKKIIVLFLITNFSFSQCWRTIGTVNGVHNIGIQTDGSLWTWGYNLYGQIGDGTFINRNVPTKIGVDTNWKFVTASELNSFAIKNNGTLWSWGRNESGQLGNGTTISQTTPTQVGSQTNWQIVSAHRFHVLAIKSNGTLWAWGKNQSGELGNGTNIESLIPVQIGTATDWAKVESCLSSSFAIKTDGTLWSWGSDLNGTEFDSSNVPVQIGTDTWTEISAKWLHVIGLKTNGTIWSWGDNEYGQLGKGNNNNSNATNQIATQIGSENNWKSVSAVIYQSMALKTDGTLWAWGDNAQGHFGNNTNTDSFVPIQIGTLTNWRSISPGQSMSIGLKTNNDRLWVWGTDLFGSLGNGSGGNSLIPATIGTCTTSLSTNDFEIVQENFKIYPNPAKDFLRINNLSDNKIEKIVLSDLFGKIILQQENAFDKIAIANLETGLYLLTILTDLNKSYQFKILKN